MLIWELRSGISQGSIWTTCLQDPFNVMYMFCPNPYEIFDPVPEVSYDYEFPSHRSLLSHSCVLRPFSHTHLTEWGKLQAQNRISHILSERILAKATADVRWMLLCICRFGTLWPGGIQCPLFREIRSTMGGWMCNLFLLFRSDVASIEYHKIVEPKGKDISRLRPLAALQNRRIAHSWFILGNPRCSLRF